MVVPVVVPEVVVPEVVVPVVVPVEPTDTGPTPDKEREEQGWQWVGSHGGPPQIRSSIYEGNGGFMSSGCQGVPPPHMR